MAFEISMLKGFTFRRCHLFHQHLVVIGFCGFSALEPKIELVGGMCFLNFCPCLCGKGEFNYNTSCSQTRLAHLMCCSFASLLWHAHGATCIAQLNWKLQYTSKITAHSMLMMQHISNVVVMTEQLYL